MNRIAIRFSLAGLVLGLPILATAAFLTTSPAEAAAPVCVPGFSTIEKKSWILRCRKIVHVSLKGVTITQANNAICKTDSYWNFGPKVVVKQIGSKVSVTYTCGHVEG